MHWYKGRSRFLRELKKPVDGRTHTDKITMKQGLEAGAFLGVTDIVKRGLPTPYGLLQWKLRKALEVGIAHALSLSREGREPTLEEEVASALGLFEEETGSYAEKGQVIHKEIIDYLEGKVVREPLANTIDGVAKTLGFIGKPVVCERPFAWQAFGGTPDLICFETKPITLIDWKTTEKLRTPYIEEQAQLAAYGKYISCLNDGASVTAFNVYIHADELRLLGIHEHSPKDMRRGWEVFVHAYRTLGLLDGYQPVPADKLERV